jgi:hypothetical protein
LHAVVYLRARWPLRLKVNRHTQAVTLCGHVSVDTTAPPSNPAPADPEKQGHGKPQCTSCCAALSVLSQPPVEFGYS